VRRAATALAIAGALVVAAWCALGVSQATGAQAARDRVGDLRPPTAAAAARTADLLDRAGRLNPDRGIDVLRARLALQRGDAAAATRIALGVARAEPANLEAWGLIALVNERRDPALAARARAELRRRSPPAP
jgi:hypothetical protein